MGDVIVTLSTGREIPINTRAMTQGEWEDFTSGTQTKTKDAEFILKVTGVTNKEWRDMLHDDARRLFQGIVKSANSPLSDPNSVKPSTSE
jgi:hypothetical protein